MIKNLIQYLENLQIVNVHIGSPREEDGKYEIPVMKLNDSSIEEVEEEPEDIKEETPNILVISLDKVLLDEQEIILDELEVDENTVLTLILESIKQKLIEAARKNDITNIPFRNDKLFGKELSTSIASLSNRILTDTHNRKDSFVIISLKEALILGNAIKQPILNKLQTEVYGCNLIINNEEIESNTIIVGSNGGDFGGLTLCIDPERFLTYKDKKTIIRYALELIGTNMHQLYRLITI